MKVTAIRTQVKNPNRFSIFIDEKYSFSLTPDQLLEQKVVVGQQLTDVRLAELQKASDFGKLHERLLHYVLLRPRSKREVEQYCRRKQFDADDCQVIIQRLIDRRYINDQSFAESWVQSRAATKPVSKRRLRAELQQKGVADSWQAAALEGYDEQAALQQVIVKKRRLARYQNDSQKLTAYLLRQGFSYDAVRQALADTTGPE